MKRLLLLVLLLVGGLLGSAAPASATVCNVADTAPVNRPNHAGGWMYTITPVDQFSGGGDISLMCQQGGTNQCDWHEKVEEFKNNVWTWIGGWDSPSCSAAPGVVYHAPNLAFPCTYTWITAPWRSKIWINYFDTYSGTWRYSGATGPVHDGSGTCWD